MDDIRYLGKLDYRIDNVNFINVTRNENFTFEFKKGKKNYSLIYVQNGELDYFFKNSEKSIHITKGDMLFVPKKMPYKTTYLSDNTQIKIIAFDCSFQHQDTLYKAPFLKKSSEISSVFNQCSALSGRNSLFLFSKVYELLYILQKFDTPKDKKHQKILPAVDEIRKNFTQNNPISYYANLCDMSESNFRKLFKEYTGFSPIEFRNRIRIAEVRKLTDSGEYSISEAAYMVGFNNMSFFYETYNKHKKEL